MFKNIIDLNFFIIHLRCLSFPKAIPLFKVAERKGILGALSYFQKWKRKISEFEWESLLISLRSLINVEDYVCKTFRDPPPPTHTHNPDESLA